MLSSTIARKAADLIEEKGWAQKAFARDAKRKEVEIKSKEAARFCLIGAITKVTPKGTVMYPDTLISAICSVIREKKLRNAKQGDLVSYPNSFGAIEDWNDQKGRTKKQVVSVLRETAKMLKKEDF